MTTEKTKALLKYEMERNEILALKILELENKCQELRRRIYDLESNPTWLIV